MSPGFGWGAPEAGQPRRGRVGEGDLAEVPVASVEAPDQLPGSVADSALAIRLPVFIEHEGALYDFELIRGRLHEAVAWSSLDTCTRCGARGDLYDLCSNCDQPFCSLCMAQHLNGCHVAIIRER